jgi:hypothetical protein
MYLKNKMRKSLYSILLILLSTAYSFAQEDSVSVVYSTESADVSNFETGRKYKYFDRNMIEEKSMFRIGTMNNFNWWAYSFVEVEQKITTSHSLIAGLSFDAYENEVLLKTAYKYFYAQKKKIKSGEKANNLIGSYLSLQYDYHFKSKEPNSNQNYRQDDYHADDFSLLWGFQKRFGRFGYFSFNTGMMYSPGSYSFFTNPNSKFEPKRLADRFSLETNIKIAFALGNLKKTNQYSTPYLTNLKSKVSELTNQLEEEQTLFKIGLTRIHVGEQYFSISNTFAVEQKVVPAISAIVELDFSFVKDSPFISSYYSTDYNLGLRYYYSLNKRIARGQSANNFSANYFSFMVKDVYSHLRYDHFNYSNKTAYIALQWGIQRKIGKHGFVDVNLELSNQDRRINFDSNITIGLSF